MTVQAGGVWSKQTVFKLSHFDFKPGHEGSKQASSLAGFPKRPGGHKVGYFAMAPPALEDANLTLRLFGFCPHEHHG